MPSRLLLIIAYIGFVSLGLPDTLLGVAWPSVRETFGVEQSSLGLVFLGSGCGYFFSSFFSGRLLQWLGIGALLAVSTGVVALSGVGYGYAPLWIAFVGASILHGLGSGGIDSGLNYYAAHHFSPRHMSWLHACYSLGATFGPIIMTGALLWAGSWRAGYASMALILLGMCLLFTATRGYWQDNDSDQEASTTVVPATIAATLAHRAVWLQIALFFVYTGLEVTVGQWSFTLLTESRGISLETAGLWVTGYWASIGLGRVLSGFIVERLGSDRLTRASTVVALIGTTLVVVSGSGPLTLAGLVLTGLALAPIYPCMMTRTPERIGKSFAAHAIGFQVSAAMIGAAVLPAGSGLLARLTLENVALAAMAMAFVLLLLHECLLRRPESRF